MKVLVFTSSKGGVGKTMAATLVGQALARRGHRAGFADFSGIAPNASGRWVRSCSASRDLPPRGWTAPVSLWPVGARRRGSGCLLARRRCRGDGFARRWRTASAGCWPRLPPHWTC